MAIIDVDPGEVESGGMESGGMEMAGEAADADLGQEERQQWIVTSQCLVLGDSQYWSLRYRLASAFEVEYHRNRRLYMLPDAGRIVSTPDARERHAMLDRILSCDDGKSRTIL